MYIIVLCNLCVMVADIADGNNQFVGEGQLERIGPAGMLVAWLACKDMSFMDFPDIHCSLVRNHFVMFTYSASLPSLEVD